MGNWRSPPRSVRFSCISPCPALSFVESVSGLGKEQNTGGEFASAADDDEVLPIAAVTARRALFVERKLRFPVSIQAFRIPPCVSTIRGWVGGRTIKAAMRSEFLGKNPSHGMDTVYGVRCSVGSSPTTAFPHRRNWRARPSYRGGHHGRHTIMCIPIFLFFIYVCMYVCVCMCMCWVLLYSLSVPSPPSSTYAFMLFIGSHIGGHRMNKRTASFFLLSSSAQIHHAFSYLVRA